MAFPTGQWRIQGKDRGPPLIFGPNKNFLGTPAPIPPPLLSKGLDNRASPLSQGLDPALRTIHGVYPNPSTQMEAQSMDCGTVSQTDLTRVTFCLWRTFCLVRSGSQSKNKICVISPARYASDRPCLQWLPNDETGIYLLRFGKVE